MRAATITCLIAAALAVAGPAAAAPERILYVGDSLGVGTTPLLSRLLGSSAQIQGDSRIGRPTPEGLQLLGQLFQPADRVVVFDLGTNDDPANPALLANDLATARRLAGNACMVVATLNRPPLNGFTVAGLNRAVTSFARSTPNVQVVDWHAVAVADPTLLGPDHVHPTPAGYGTRAELFAQAISQCGTTTSVPAPTRVAPRPAVRPRVATPRPRPRIKVPGIESSGITFSQPLKVGGVSAQLAYPSSKPPYAAVVLAGGSSADAQVFVADGLAALNYLAPGTPATARAAVALLARQKGIRPGAVALWGRGEAAPVVAAAAAGDPHVAAVVVTSPDTLPPAELRDWRIRRALGTDAAPVTKWLRLRARNEAALRSDPATRWSVVEQPLLALWTNTDQRFPARASALRLQQVLATGRNSDRTFRWLRSDADALTYGARWVTSQLNAKPVPVISTPLPPTGKGPQPTDVADASAVYSLPVQLLWLIAPALLLAAGWMQARRESGALIATTALTGVATFGVIGIGIATILSAEGRDITTVAGMPWLFGLARLLAIGLGALAVVLARRRAWVAAAGGALWLALALFWLL